MTYRERREARAERLRGWAEKRQASATAALNSQPELRHDWAFITQPGRIVARERMNASDDRAFRSLQKAESMAARADGIEAQAAHAIYSDDPDAAIQTIRAALRRRTGRAWSVTGGRGTAWGWIEIDAPPARRTWAWYLPAGAPDEPGQWVVWDLWSVTARRKSWSSGRQVILMTDGSLRAIRSQSDYYLTER